MEPKTKFLYILSFVSFTYWMTLLISPIFPLFITEELGASTFLLGTIIAIAPTCSIIFRVPLGVVGDRIGRWLMLSLSLSITMLVNIFYMLTPTYSWLYVIELLRATASAIFFSTANAVASSLARFSGERGKIMGRYMTSIALALVLGPLLCSMLLELAMSYRQIFLITAMISASGLTASLICGRFVKKGGYDKTNIVKHDVRRSLSRVIKSRNMIALFLTMSIFYFTSLGVFQTLFSVYAKRVLFYSPALISLLYSIRGLSDTFARIPAGYISDRLGRKRPLMLGLSLMVAAILCISTSNFYTIIFGFIVYGVGFGFRVVNMTALAGDSVPNEDVGLAMAILIATTDAGSSLGALFAGFLSEFPTPFVLQIAALMLLAVIPILSLVKEKQPSEQATGNSSIQNTKA